MVKSNTQLMLLVKIKIHIWVIVEVRVSSSLNSPTKMENNCV